LRLKAEAVVWFNEEGGERMTVVAGRRVLITGASSGIGAALAREFGAHECAIFLVARRVERLRQLAEELRANGIEVHYAGCDVAKPGEVAVAARELHRRLGGIDIAVLNAGIIGHVDIQDFRAAGVERTMQVNFMGAVNWLEPVLPWLLQQGRGAIVGISSLASVRGLVGSAAYSASKAALSTFLESLRVELRPRGIQVLTVEPGFVHTELNEDYPGPLPFVLDVEEAARRIVNAIRQGRAVARFPLTTSLGASLLHILPATIYDALSWQFRQRMDKR